jgi:hypothetical protein
VTFDRTVVVDAVRLPLIKFSDSGNIWLEVHSDRDGKPDELAASSLRLASTRIRFMMIEDPWLTFPLGDPLELQPGSYWFVLRSTGSCIFNWNASGGNVVGGAGDTRFLDVNDRDRGWNNLVNLDLNFQIHGEIAP